MGQAIDSCINKGIPIQDSIRMKFKNHKILLTGGSGQLGKAIIASQFFPPLLVPPHTILDLTQPEKMRKFILNQDFNTIIHCAALARMAQCETDPRRAIQMNIMGTGHLVSAVMEKEWVSGEKIRFIHISSDGVYSGNKGNYSERDETIPYNKYGWTKLGAECVVRLLSNYCIIRTSFFDPYHIPYESSAVDIFSSKVPIGYLVKAIAFLSSDSYIGVINVGSKRQSDYDRYKKFKSELTPRKADEILKDISFPMARDASLDCRLWEKIFCNKI